MDGTQIYQTYIVKVYEREKAERKDHDRHRTCREEVPNNDREREKKKERA